ncbi:MAG TPA: helix-turn-helix transcriptional regulator [Candidatus Choladousia intestinavium]|uniref:Helix-turn-helix transcriptional regulator n=1 Tax=Candidatus Choladousia intestinavium TaxID=2840727 RepID=A0A9D1AC12_9FIRM|nr:helix-turn-helix transcriptional regulator [Candidatus Choladousia intestinavium]
MAAYQVFPGIQLSLNDSLCEQVSFHHEAHAHILEINHCQTGRIGWNFNNGTSVYLGPGDLSLHSMECCADSVMMFPLGYCESISVSINLEELKKYPLPVLQEASVSIERLGRDFCRPDKSVALPSSPAIEGIFRPLYMVPAEIRLPYFKLKVQELLLYLGSLNPNPSGLTQYCSRQTALIREIHTLLTEHLEHRFTIDELSKKYLINTSSLKEVFKGVYGLPIATYMKEYRIRKGMELLRQTDDSIAEIAAKVGYESQGKFTKAFKDSMKITPTAYRKKYGR